jgi:nitronate monooxygenase
MIVEHLQHPLVLAPMAGGPSTPELAASVSQAGALGFLAAGYVTATQLEQLIGQTRALTSRPFGVNVFVPDGALPGEGVVADYVKLLQPVSDELGVALGHGRHDDDDWEAKLDLLGSIDVAVVSFTFGCPSTAVIDRLHAAGTEAWVTVTTPAEAATASEAGADVVVAQGVEAGGHQAVFRDDQDERRERFTCSSCWTRSTSRWWPPAGS